MKLSGGCYCGAIRYEADGAPLMAGQCHCRECQHISGGGPNYFMVMPLDGFVFTKGTPKQFEHPDIDGAVSRLFCEKCGTPFGNYSPPLPGAIVLRVGTLDDPSVFTPQAAYYTVDKQPFHHIPDDMTAFHTVPT